MPCCLVVVLTLTPLQAARVELTEEMGGGYTEAQITEYAHAKASSKFAAWFAVPYLGFEVLFKLTQVGQ